MDQTVDEISMVKNEQLDELKGNAEYGQMQHVPPKEVSVPKFSHNRKSASSEKNDFQLEFHPNLNPNFNFLLYVRIEGLSPFVIYPVAAPIEQAESLYRCHHHIKIIERYVSNILPDEELLLRRRLYFFNHLNMGMEKRSAFIEKRISYSNDDVDEKNRSTQSLKDISKIMSSLLSYRSIFKNVQVSEKVLEEFYKEIQDSYEIRADFEESEWWDKDAFFVNSNQIEVPSKTQSLQGNPCHVFLYEFRRSSVRMEYSMELQQKIHLYYWILDSNQVNWIKETDLSHISDASTSSKCHGVAPRLITLNRLFQFIILEVHSKKSLHTTVFLRCYSMFFNHYIFIQKIEEAWECPDIAEWLMRSNPLFQSGNISDNDREALKHCTVTQLDMVYHRATVVPRIRLRVLQLLYRWVEEIVPTLSEDPQVLQRIQRLLASMNQYILKDIHSNHAHPYLLLLNKISTMVKHLSPPIWKRKLKSIYNVLFNDIPPPNSLKIQVLLSHTSKEIAENLTVFDYLLYNRIEPFELLQQRWSKQKTKYQTVNLNASINFVNRIGSIICQSILIQTDDRKRKRIIKKWLKILNELIIMNSFNMMTCVCGALQNASIYRLKSTWAQVKEKHLAPLTKAKQISSAEGNYKHFRKLFFDLYEQGKSVSPYIGFMLKDLILCEEGSPSFIDGKINFSKALRTWNLVSKAIQFQSSDKEDCGRYSYIKPNSEIIHMLEHWKCLSEEELYEMSLAAEPKK